MQPFERSKNPIQVNLFGEKMALPMSAFAPQEGYHQPIFGALQDSKTPGVLARVPKVLLSRDPHCAQHSELHLDHLKEELLFPAARSGFLFQVQLHVDRP